MDSPPKGKIFTRTFQKEILKRDHLRRKVPTDSQLKSFACRVLYTEQDSKEK